MSQLAELFAESMSDSWTLGSDSYDRRCNEFILDAYTSMVDELDWNKLREFVDGNSSVKSILQQGADKHHLYRQPVSLLLMYLISVAPVKVRSYWPLTKELLRPLFTDMGVTFTTEAP